MLVYVEMNRFGHLEIDPVSDRQRRQLVRRMWAKPAKGDSLGYVPGDVESFLEHLPKRAARDIRAGWPTRVRIRDDHADALFGAE